MAFTLKQLRYVVAAAEAGSITGASRRLAIAQPSLSAAVAQLEAEFGLQLFVRHRSQGLTLTPSGSRFLASARRLLEQADALSADARGLQEALDGPLSLGCFQTLAPVLLPRLLRDFAEAQPGIDISLHEEALDRLQGGLVNGGLELALLYEIDLSPRLDIIRLASAAPYVLLGEGHRLAGQPTIGLAELVEEPMVLLDLPHSREYFRSFFLSIGAEPNVRYRTASFEMVRGLVANGHGFTILNIRTVSERSYDGKRLLAKPLKDRVPPLPIVLAYLRGTRLTRRAQVFAEFCRGFFQSAP